MEEKDLLQAMDALADTESQLDLLEAEKETLKQSRIPLEIQGELESIDFEYADKIKNIEDNIRARKEQLQACLKAYAKPIKSQYYSYSYDEAPEWNDEGLCKYAMIHNLPEILSFRSTKPKTRLAPRKK